MFTLKPFDAETVEQEAKRTGIILTCENHNYLSGLGSAVAEVIAERAPAKLGRVGIKEEFGEVGPVDYLKERFGLRGEDITAAALKLLGK